jgi:two-component system sensor histidine kinase RegB
MRCDEWLEALHAGWLALRGDVASRIDIGGAGPAPNIVVEPTLEQGVVNLLNNAARNGGAVALRAGWSAEALFVEVSDDGPGFPEAVLRDGGSRPFPPHAQGSGIGLLLTRAAIERLGGRLVLSNPPAGGALARIEIPLARIAL